MRTPIPKILTRLLLVSCFAAVLACRADETSDCFDRIVQPTGWRLPRHSAFPLRKGVVSDLGIPGITFSSFRVRNVFFLPRYAIDGKRLLLISFRFRTDEIKRLEVNGVRFAYVASVRGVDVGIAGLVWWIDRDGDGRLEEFAWHPTLTEVPEWVRNRASTPPR